MKQKQKKKKNILSILSISIKSIILLILAVAFLYYPGQNVYTFAQSQTVPEETVHEVVLPKPAPYPKNINQSYPGQEISASGIVVLDVASGVFLYKRNEEEKFAPASTTKILTALVAIDSFDPDAVLTVNTVMNNGQSMGLVKGERMTLENLLYGTLVFSGNDAAYTLAENYPGGVDAFVVAMNAKALALHLNNSHFTNSVGYDDPLHKITATDLARLASVAISNKLIAKIVAVPQITVSDVTFTYFHALKNVNQLLGKIPGVGGIKTGWTEEAGENLVTLVEREGHKEIIVTLKSKDRFEDTKNLINWIFSSYQWETIQ
ncbi:D-alanyl-D-alanine carboxypeptidase [Candidatus Gottesmanbacteria bacterium]|nr:D-alanyl-D-alanine carboxypeptidase [Candidatus Gottesmanbacteria bacterium]